MKVTDINLNGLILAGGYSKRMGRDKALLEFHGKPQIEYIWELAGKFCKQVFISKRADQAAYKNLPFINDADQFISQGPLGGILSAMQSAPQTSWLVLACDLPYVEENTLKALMEGRNPQKTATAFISTQDRLPEPLCAVWEGHAYPYLEQLFDKGMRCPRKVLMNCDAQLLSQANPRWLDNINTPQELAAVVKIEGQKL